MWSPTHVQVQVLRAKGLKPKGKNGTNDAFVTMALGKEKFQTTVVEQASSDVEWREQADLQIPSHGNTAEVVLTALHRNLLGVDQFLGRVALPLKDFDHTQRPTTRWYPLQSKPSQNKPGYRGELEVRVGFTVQSMGPSSGSTTDLKTRGSSTSIHKVKKSLGTGGSLINLKVKSAGHKLGKLGNKMGSSLKLGSAGRDLGAVSEEPKEDFAVNRDPGVGDSEDEDEGMEQIFKRMPSQRKTPQPSPVPPPKPERQHLDNSGAEKKVAGSGLATAQAKETPAGKFDDKDVSTKASENANTTDGSLDKVSEQTMAQFSGTSKDELVKEVVGLRRSVEEQGKKLVDLENYIDTLVAAVMEEQPSILDQGRLINRPGRGRGRSVGGRAGNIDWRGQNWKKFG